MSDRRPWYKEDWSQDVLDAFRDGEITEDETWVILDDREEPNYEEGSPFWNTW